MKQVIIRVQNERGRTFAKFYYTSYAQYYSYADKDVLNYFKEGTSIYIKVGNQYSRFIDFEDCKETLEEYPQDYEDLKAVLWHDIYSYDVMFYVKEYLPRY